jgi:hypothetical protein
VARIANADTRRFLPELDWMSYVAWVNRGTCLVTNLEVCMDQGSSR